jgi:hypothetical protein
MICKCGATVKARAGGAEITRFGRFGHLAATLADGMPGPEPGHGGSGIRLEVGAAQEFGTIEGCSKDVTRGNEFRSWARWNSICRSKALERMIGNRVMTFSRTAR